MSFEFGVADEALGFERVEAGDSERALMAAASRAKFRASRKLNERVADCGDSGSDSVRERAARVKLDGCGASPPNETSASGSSASLSSNSTSMKSSGSRPPVGVVAAVDVECKCCVDLARDTWCAWLSPAIEPAASRAEREPDERPKSSVSRRSTVFFLAPVPTLRYALD